MGSIVKFELLTALRRMQAENDQTSQEAIVAPNITEKTKQGIASMVKLKKENQRLRSRGLPSLPLAQLNILNHNSGLLEL